jgi:histidinol-phosphate phosphatase family protein
VTVISYDVVVPTIGRPSLGPMLRALAAGGGPWPEEVFVVDDRPTTGVELEIPMGVVPTPVTVLRSMGHGPAAARNIGWRAGKASWTVFLDDDVLPRPGWRADLAGDLGRLDPIDAGSQGRIVVPRPAGRAPTDWERNVAGLERARWVTADMAYRRTALELVGGFDERFPRAYREDADLALRVREAGFRLYVGERTVEHPVRPAPWWLSVRAQAGNADDMLMRRVHGRQWRSLAEAGRGSARQHLRTTAAGTVAVAALLSGRRRRRLVAAVAGVTWLAGATSFCLRRILPGPRTAGEIATMAATSLAIPPVATWQLMRGWLRARRLVPRRRPAAVLFDRDGTLIEDVPYNGDPELVVPVPGAREALDRLRVARIRTAVVSNQSGVARGLITEQQVRDVNRRTEQLLGPLGPWLICYHASADDCGCRKPRPGLIEQAAAALDVTPEDCAVIGDIGADVDSATAAGAVAILVPNNATRRAEIDAAAIVAGDLSEALDILIGPRR